MLDEYEPFRAALNAGAETRRSGIQKQLDRAHARIEELDAEVTKLKARLLKADDGSYAAQTFEEAMETAANERHVVGAEADRLRADLLKIGEEATNDVALDIFARLADAIRAGGNDTAALNDRLRTIFAEFKIGVEGGEFQVWPVLRSDLDEETADATYAMLMYADEASAHEPAVTPELLHGGAGSTKVHNA